MCLKYTSSRWFVLPSLLCTLSLGDPSDPTSSPLGRSALHLPPSLHGTPHSFWAQIPFGVLYPHCLVDLSTCLNVTGSSPLLASPHCLSCLRPVNWGCVEHGPQSCCLSIPGIALVWVLMCPLSSYRGLPADLPCVCSTLPLVHYPHPLAPQLSPPPPLQVFAVPFSSSHLCSQCPLSLSNALPPSHFPKASFEC